MLARAAGRGSYEGQVRVATELATVTVATVVLTTAALPTTGDEDRPGLMVTSLLLFAFAYLWYHGLPERLLGRERFLVGTVIAQCIAAFLLHVSGGPASAYFSLYILPILATVFDLRVRGPLTTGTVALGAFLVVWFADPYAAGTVEQTRVAALIRLFLLGAVIVLSALIARTLGRARLQLRTEEERQRALFAALRDPILTATGDGRITGFNPAAAELFGRSAQLLGKRIAELLPFTASPPEPGAAQPTWRGTVPHLTGASMEVEATETALTQAEAGALRAYVLHDISRHTELTRLREQLLYSVAHELRSPLAVLENALEILHEDYASLSAIEFSQVMQSARRTAVRIRSLMENLLSAGNIESGRFVVVPRATSLQALVADAVEATDALTRTRQQRLEVEVPDAMTVLADERYARQVLSNLISNASKYSPDGGTITLRGEPLNGAVRVTVEDRGPGIPADQQVGIFQRFYRARPGNYEPGVGLGLAIAKGIVEAHGGRIGIESREGAGTRVWFTLPAAKAGP